MCRRQLSTFARSLSSGSSLIVSLIAPGPRFVLSETNPADRCSRPGRWSRGLGVEVEVVGELLQSRLQDGSLGVEVADDGVETAAQLDLHFGDAALEPGHELVALSLELGHPLRDALLDALRSRIGDL